MTAHGQASLPGAAAPRGGKRPGVRALCGAATPRMVRRSLLTAAVVGAILFGVNSGDTLARTGLTTALVLKFAATMMIPFVVSLASSAATHLELRAEGTRDATCTNPACPKRGT